MAGDNNSNSDSKICPVCGKAGDSEGLCGRCGQPIIGFDNSTQERPIILDTSS